MAVKKKAKIADTTFKTGQDGTLATPDIYANPPQTPVGATTSVISGGGSIDLSKVTQLPSNTPLLGNNTTMVKGALGLTSLVLGAVAGDIKINKDILKKLDAKVITNMATAMGYPQLAKLPSLVNKIDYKNPQFLDNIAKANPIAKATIDGVKLLIKGKDINDVNSLLSVVGEFTGNTELGSILGISSELAFAKVVIDSANEFGIPALGKKILDKYTDKKEKRHLELNTANSLAAGTNLSELNTLVDTYGSDSVLFINTNIVKTLLSSYTKPLIDTTSAVSKDTTTLLNELKQSLIKIDKNWAYTTLGTNNVYDLEVFSSLSTDAYDLFLTDNELRLPTATAKEFNTNIFSDSISMLQTQYPYAPYGA